MELTPELITQYGLIQKVSTGHPYLDMLLVMLLPLVIRTLLPWVTKFVEMLWHRDVEDQSITTREIEYKKNMDYYWYESRDGPSNSILQKALLNYINTHPEVLRALPKADYQLKKKYIESKVKYAEDSDDSECESDDDHNYAVNAMPPHGTWVDMKNGVRFMHNEEQADDKGKCLKSVFTLESMDKNGIDQIENFVEEALELYKKQQANKKVDHSRYLYIPVITGLAMRTGGGGDDAEGDNAPSAQYKRYKLSEEKTFASFFHPDQDSILQLVSQFVNKTGKFGIAGYPQKLGFLLYGPPGTGKTSFIKALAQHTKRSIISIPLTKIRTNQELMDIMMDQNITVQNQDGNINLPYSKTIFILEDVDAASTVVQRRAPEDIEVAAMPAAISARQSQIQSTAKASKKRVKKDTGSGSDSDKEGKKKDTPRAPAGYGPQMPMMGGRSIFGGEDELNLAGLLNVLDGVVDTPNRIVIMTTNHPEKLDPALIRPGRINKKIYMGRICFDQALAMIKHYYGDIPTAVQTLLRSLFIDGELSPAELEAMCAEFDLVDHLANQLVSKFAPAIVTEVMVMPMKHAPTTADVHADVHIATPGIKAG